MDAAELPEPVLPALERPYGVLVTGVGGTGVVTIGGLLGMAAHLERKGVTVLDMAGLAQKGGAVLSHVQIAPAPAGLHATRIATGEAPADRLRRHRVGIAGSAVEDAAGRHRRRRQQRQHADRRVHRQPQLDLPGASAEQEVRAAVGEACAFRRQCLGGHAAGRRDLLNPLLLGFAWQKGWIPLTLASLVRAIELNAVAVEKNPRLHLGRALAHRARQRCASAGGGAGQLRRCRKRWTACCAGARRC